MIEHISYAEKLEDEKWIQKKRDINRRDKCQCKLCGATENLNVHHRYYIFQADPWAYPNDALVTLCRSCHELVHSTLPPLIYANRQNSLIRMMFTPCKRCGGYGYFSEYKHVQNGICFRCRGQRFEELINLDESARLFEDASAKVFDSLTINPNAETLFLKGKILHSENREKAKELYYEAATSGFGKAQNNLGLIFEEEGNIEFAKRLFLYAAMQGIGQGIRNLGLLLKKQGNVETFSKWLPILKKDKHFVCGTALEIFSNFLSQNDKKPSLEVLFSSIDTLVSLASSGFKPAIKIVEEYNIKEIQQAIIDEFEQIKKDDTL